MIDHQDTKAPNGLSPDFTTARHSRESGNPVDTDSSRIPAFAGMTNGGGGKGQPPWCLGGAEFCWFHSMIVTPRPIEQVLVTFGLILFFNVPVQTIWGHNDE